MFGFERGAFTDARRAKPGLLQTAHRGTIFLDEVGLLSGGLQAKLLKVLEERTVRRLRQHARRADRRLDPHRDQRRSEVCDPGAPLPRGPLSPPRRADALAAAAPRARRRHPDARRALSRPSVHATTACRPRPWPPTRRRRSRRTRGPATSARLANLMERVALLSSDPTVTADALGLTAGRRRRRRPPRCGSRAGRVGELARRRRARPGCRRAAVRPAGTSRARRRCSESRETPCGLASRSMACGSARRRRRRRRARPERRAVRRAEAAAGRSGRGACAHGGRAPPAAPAPL